MEANIILAGQGQVINNIEPQDPISEKDSQDGMKFNKYLTRELKDSSKKIDGLQNEEPQSAEELPDEETNIDQQASLENSALFLLIQELMKEVIAKQPNDAKLNDQAAEVENLTPMQINDLLQKKIESLPDKDRGALISWAAQKNARAVKLDKAEAETEVKDISQEETQSLIEDIVKEITQQNLIKDNFAQILTSKETLNKHQENALELLKQIAEQNSQNQNLDTALNNVLKQETDKPLTNILGTLNKDVKEAALSQLNNNLNQDSSLNGKEEDNSNKNFTLVKEIAKPDKAEAKDTKVDINKTNKESLGFEDTLKEKINMSLGKQMDTKLEASLSSAKDVQQTQPKVFTAQLDVKQIANDISINISKGNSEVRISMKPEYLGELSVKVNISTDNVTLAMKTDNQYAKEVIEANFNQLKEALTQHGIKVASFEVTTSADMNLNNNSLNTRFDGSQKDNAKQNYSFDNEPADRETLKDEKEKRDFKQDDAKNNPYAVNYLA